MRVSQQKILKESIAFVFTEALHARQQASHSKRMLSVWPSRQRATLAILKLLPVFKLFAAAVTDGIQAHQRTRTIYNDHPMGAL